MPKKPLTIGELHFDSKGAATEHFRALLHKHPIGHPMGEPDATELYWLFERHPEFAAKKGDGISGFAVRDALYGKRCFELIRTDGTKTDFSAQTCLDGKEPDAQAQAIAAMRAEVTNQIIQKKWQSYREGVDSQGVYKCPLTGTPITMDEASVYFVPPKTFRALALQFATESNISLDKEFVSPSKDNQYEPQIRDRNVAAAWWDWHERHAEIRAVLKQRAKQS